MPRSIQSVSIALMAGLLTFGGCGGAEHPAEDGRAAIAVRVATVTADPVQTRTEAVGTVASKTTVQISSQVMGRVTAVHVRLGDRVRAGQLLVEIDAREAAARATSASAGVTEAQQGLVEAERAIQAAEQARAAAEANERLARVTYERYSQLAERRSVSPQEFDEVAARHSAARAELERARSNVEMIRARRDQMHARIAQARSEAGGASVALGYTRITAPQAGIVTAKSVEAGAMASPGTPLLTIEDETAYRLEASVEESLAGSVRLGAELPVWIDALGPVESRGIVSEVAPSSSPASRTVLVKIDLPGAPGLRSGLYGRTSIPSGEHTAVLVPAEAVVERGQMTSVFVLEETGGETGDETRVARTRFVTLGKRYDALVEVLSGLGEGERIAVSNLDQLADGVKVSIEAPG